MMARRRFAYFPRAATYVPPQCTPSPRDENDARLTPHHALLGAPCYRRQCTCQRQCFLAFFRQKMITEIDIDDVEDVSFPAEAALVLPNTLAQIALYRAFPATKRRHGHAIKAAPRHLMHARKICRPFRFAAQSRKSSHAQRCVSCQNRRNAHARHMSRRAPKTLKPRFDAILLHDDFPGHFTMGQLFIWRTTATPFLAPARVKAAAPYKMGHA